MMSHSRVRKALPSENPRVRPCVGKASGDCTASNINLKQPKHRSRSNNKIPKSIRYDLENALVGLCDVWFEDIKPHLVRNNIKVHVHESGTGVSADAEAGEASGDHSRLPPGAPGCSHLDPGAASDHRRRLPANYARYYSTLQAASRVLYRRLQAPSQLQMPEMHSMNEVSNKYQDCENKKARVPRKYRKRRSVKEPLQMSQYNWQVPRLCRTYSILSPAVIPQSSYPSPTRKIYTALHSPPRASTQDNTTMNIQGSKRNRMINKGTQTEWCYQEASHSRPCKTSLTESSAPSPPRFGRCPANTSIFLQRTKKPSSIVDKPLLKDDLINIIEKKYDKMISVLYTSPTNNESILSIMNLMPSPKNSQRDARRIKKNLPWR